MFLGRVHNLNPQRAGRHRALGIDIGQHAIKAVLLEGGAARATANDFDLDNTSEAGAAVCGSAHVQTPDGAVQKGVVVRPREVAAALRQIMRRLNDGAGGAATPVLSRASLAAPADQAVVRWIDLPGMDADALRAATRFEARKYLSYPVDEAEIEIWAPPAEAAMPLRSDEATAQKMLLVATPKNVLRSRAEALEAAGLEVAGVELEMFALMRALRHAENADGRGGAAGAAATAAGRGAWARQRAGTAESVAYLQIGAEVSGMCVVRNGRIGFLRVISWGGNRLTDALAAETAPTPARAVKEGASARLDENGVFSWHDEKAGTRRETGVLLPELDRLGREIQRLLNYYRSLYPENSAEGMLSRLIFCGGTANLHGLPAYFANKLQVEVRARSPFAFLLTAPACGAAAARRPAKKPSLHTGESWPIGDSATFEAEENAGSKENSFGVAVGLALGDLATHARERDARRAPHEREYVWRRDNTGGGDFVAPRAAA